MDDRTGSSYGLVRDTKRESWILTCPVDRWHVLRPPAVSAERRPMAAPLAERPRSPGVFAPLVVLVLTIATAALLHALR